MRHRRAKRRAFIGESDMNTMRTALPAAILCAARGQAAGALRPALAQADPAKAQYDAERARCMSGSPGQDQASCLRSAGAAYDSARQGKLTNPNMQFHDNALPRSATLPPSDRADCASRVDGGGDASGSVK